MRNINTNLNSVVFLAVKSVQNTHSWLFQAKRLEWVIKCTRWWYEAIWNETRWWKHAP